MVRDPFHSSLEVLVEIYEQKASGVIRVYSAREMTKKERQVYRQNAR
jgi:uncharacterized DUF497 family protein